MFRCIISSYLAVVALIGPGLCCCTTVRMLGSSSAVGDGTVAAAPKSTGCQHCHHSSTEKKHEKPCDPSKKSPSCPCKDHEAIPVAPQGSQSDISKLTAQSELLPLLFFAFADVTGVQGVGTPDGDASSHPLSSGCFSGREILRAFRVMRC